MGYIIYGSDSCKYCVLAKELLITKGIEYTYHDITKTKTEVLDSLAEKTGNQRTMPVIFHDQIFIGGYTKLLDQFDSFELDDTF